MKCHRTLDIPGHRTLDIPTSPVWTKPVVFTSTRVPKFAGVTSWGKYRQVFDAIALLNGWSDATAALQLLSHLEGDALNVALVVPETPIWNSVDHCWVWESHADTEAQKFSKPGPERALPIYTVGELGGGLRLCLDN